MNRVCTCNTLNTCTYGISISPLTGIQSVLRLQLHYSYEATRTTDSHTTHTQRALSNVSEHKTLLHIMHSIIHVSTQVSLYLYTLPCTVSGFNMKQ